MTSQSESNPRPWATVTDSQGRAWMLRITLAQAIQLRAKRGVDLLASDSGKTAMQVAGDVAALCEIAYDISAMQRGQLGIVEESDFLAAFDGDSWQDLIDATVEGIIDFFPSSRRTAVAEVWRRQKLAANRAAEQVTKRVMEPATLDMMDREADKALEEFERKMSELGAIRS